MKLLGISGSLRASSSTAAIVRAVGRVIAPDDELVIWAGLAELPAFSPDLDIDPVATEVTRLRHAIGAADALVIVSPEYAHGMPGSLKNALDWLVSAAEPIHKPVLLVSASPSGAAYAHAQLLEVLQTMSMIVVDGGAHVFSRAKLDSAGELCDGAIISALAAGVARLRS